MSAELYVLADIEEGIANARTKGIRILEALPCNYNEAETRALLKVTDWEVV